VVVGEGSEVGEALASGKVPVEVVSAGD